MERKAKRCRQSHGSVQHWKQADCWYFTQPGTKKRVALFDEHGEWIRGKENKAAAEVALAKEKLSWADNSGEPAGGRGPGSLCGSVPSISDTVNEGWRTERSVVVIETTRRRG